MAEDRRFALAPLDLREIPPHPRSLTWARTSVLEHAFPGQLEIEAGTRWPR